VAEPTGDDLMQIADTTKLAVARALLAHYCTSCGVILSLHEGKGACATAAERVLQLESFQGVRAWEARRGR